MAFNGSGTFNRLYNWVTDDGNGINIEASRMDGEDDGFATGLSNCITKDGQTTITANIPFNSKKITGLANGSARTDSIALGQVQDNSFGTLGTLGGSANTYTASPSPSITAYATGMEFNLKVNADNTGASTLNVSAVGAKDIKKYDGAGSKLDVEAGDLQQDQYYKVIYDGTDFVVLGKNPATTTNQGIVYLPKPITIANNSTDADHDIDFGAGVMQFDDGTGQAATSALTKQFDATFALGTNAGGMVSGESIPASSFVYVYAISTADGSLTDIIGTTTKDGSTISGDSVVSANSLTKKQYLGAIPTDASNNIRAGKWYVSKDEYEFNLSSIITSLTKTAPLATTLTNITLTAPPNSKARISHHIQAATTDNLVYIYLSEKDIGNEYISLIARDKGGVNGFDGGVEFIRVDSSSNIQYKASSSSGTYIVDSLGWIEKY